MFVRPPISVPKRVINSAAQNKAPLKNSYNRITMPLVFRRDFHEGEMLKILKKTKTGRQTIENAEKYNVKIEQRKFIGEQGYLEDAVNPKNNNIVMKEEISNKKAAAVYVHEVTHVTDKNNGYDLTFAEKRAESEVNAHFAQGKHNLEIRAQDPDEKEFTSREQDIMSAIEKTKDEHTAKIVIRKILSSDPGYEKLFREADVEKRERERIKTLSSKEPTKIDQQNTSKSNTPTLKI